MILLTISWYKTITKLKDLSGENDPPLTKSFLINKYSTKLNTVIHNSSRLKFYGYCCENELVMPQYLNLKNAALRRKITKIRISAHKLGVLTQKYNENANGMCSTCNLIEDELHVLFHCQKNTDHRNTLIRKVETFLGHDFDLLSDSRKASYLFKTIPENLQLCKDLGQFVKLTLE